MPPIRISVPEHTHQAREVLGQGPVLLLEQTVVLTDDAAVARAILTDWLRAYLVLPNYANGPLRSGFTEEDLARKSSLARPRFARQARRIATAVCSQGP